MFSPPIIPRSTPIVTPAVPPTRIPFFHPNTSTIKIHAIFFIEKFAISKSPNAEKAIVNRTLTAITSSTVNTVFSPYSFINVRLLLKIL